MKRTWAIRPSTEEGSDEGFIRDDSRGTVYVGEGTWGAPRKENDGDKGWTRASGSFNQVKWVIVRTDRIEVRSVKFDNADEVGTVKDNAPFEPPANIDVWSPPGGPVITLKPQALPDAAALKHLQGYQRERLKLLASWLPSKIADGWRIGADAFGGAEGPKRYRYHCEPRIAAWVRGVQTDVSTMSAELSLDSPPPDRNGILEIEGQRSQPNATIQILINKVRIFKGPNDFVFEGWSRKTFPLPKGTLRKGKNIIEIRQLGTEGWFMISEVLVRFPKQ